MTSATTTPARSMAYPFWSLMIIAAEVFAVVSYTTHLGATWRA